MRKIDIFFKSRLKWKGVAIAVIFPKRKMFAFLKGLAQQRGGQKPLDLQSNDNSKILLFIVFISIDN